MNRVCALVVTRNRLDKLKNCLAALEAQTRPPDVALVVDNASSDGTEEFLAQAEASSSFPILSVSLEENLGGAGGFAHGIRLFLDQTDCDALWLMDDDSLPEPSALSELLEGMKRADSCGNKPYLAASQVIWQDGQLHPWNIPQPRLAKNARDFALVRQGLLPIRSSSFVSLLLTRDAVNVHGLPLADYFLYNDDLEYTGRILRHGLGILCPASVCLHDTPKSSTAFVLSPERLFLEVRNKLWMIFYSPAWTFKERLWLGAILGKNILVQLKNVRNWPGIVGAVARGAAQALLRRPQK